LGSPKQEKKIKQDDHIDFTPSAEKLNKTSNHFFNKTSDGKINYEYYIGPSHFNITALNGSMELS
jgi:uncharacterized protein YpmS